MTAEKENQKGQEQNDVGYFFNFREVLNYYFRKKDPNRKIDTNLKMMHGINKISIIIFLIALIVIITRFVVRSM